MVATITKTGFEIAGKYKRKIYSFTSTGVTTFSIVHGIKTPKFSVVVNKTGDRAGQSIDDTTTAGTTVIAGLTSGDSGYYVVEGK
jgi:hypothetical protein